MNKKGLALGDMYPAVLTILLLVIALGIGLFVLDQTANAISNEDIVVNNETISAINTAGRAVSASTDCGFSGFKPISATNSLSNNTILPLTLYTYNADTGVIFGAGSNTTNLINLTYTYKGAVDTSSTGPCGSISTTGTGLAGLASWIAVLVVVIAAAIVLGIVISSFGSKPAV